MELMKNRNLTASRMDNVRKIVLMLFAVFSSTAFTCKSYEYQILLAKPVIIGVVFTHPIEQYLHSNFMARIN